MTSLPSIRASSTPWLLIAVALGFCPSAARAQTFDFQLRVTQNNNVFIVPNGTTLTLAPTALGQVASATVTVIYEGTTEAIFSSQPQLLGPTTFSVSMLSGVPLTVAPGNSFDLTVTYTPTSAASAAAQLNLPFVEQQVSNGQIVEAGGVIQINLAGTAPNLSVSYAFQSNQNVLPLANGSSLTFPGTLVNTTATAEVIIANQGSASGQVNSISLTGAAFQAQGLPLTPFSIPAGNQLTFQIIYSPTAVQADTGTLAINLGGNAFSAALAGSGINFQYTYQMITASATTTFQANQTLSLPDTAVGSSTSVTIKVQNTGNAAGTVAAIGTTAGPFTITNGPILPKILNPNDVLTFTLNFAPTQTGKNTGNMQVGNDLFNLAGNGLGAQLTFTYGTTIVTTVQSGGAVIFSPIQVGQTASLPFTVTNNGTITGQVASIGVTDTHGIFAVSNLPGLPMTLDPGASFTFTISFSPNTTGFSTSLLEIDTQTFNLTGSGTPPPALPAVQFTGASGNVNGFSQPAIGMSLASPYPLDVSGTLTITITSTNFNPDPAVQFGTGGLTVNFTIPANTTEAVFASGSNQVLLQTGSTAETIAITAALATAGGYNLTPATPPSVALTVPASAPTLLSVVLISESLNGFSLQIVGFSTPHSLTSLGFQFTTESGAKLSSSSVSIDVSGAATNWYATTASQPFGGQFQIEIPFTLSQGSSTTTTSLVSKIQSVAVTASNAQGTSNSQTVTITGP